MKPLGFWHKQTIDSDQQPRRTIRSKGFSLFELTLVLVILVALGSLIIPAIDGALKEREFQRQADEIRILWQQTRLKAMRTGQAQMFRFVVGSGQFSIEPWMQASDEVDASAGATVMMAGGLATLNSAGGMMAPAAPTAATSTSSAESLQEGYLFSAGSILGDSRSLLVTQQTGTVIGGAQNQAAPVMFYPDGTTSTAEVAIQNKFGAQRLIRMRGLTGEVLVVRAMGVAK